MLGCCCLLPASRRYREPVQLEQHRRMHEAVCVSLTGADKGTVLLLCGTHVHHSASSATFKVCVQSALPHSDLPLSLLLQPGC